MRVHLDSKHGEIERDLNRALTNARPILRKSKSANTAGRGDPDMEDGELAFFSASESDNRLILKYKGRYWYFVAVKSTAPVNGASVVALTDSTGGTADDTVAAVSGSGADATINNNFADLVRKVNEIRTVLANLGYIR